MAVMDPIGTAGIGNPFQWVAGMLASRRETRAARTQMLREMGICTVCRTNTVEQKCDRRCTQCELECASVP
ncbi:hypothetical protein Q5H91_09945 [Sphingomonas sp. KR1UV-12]|uniref:Uncharacterized protein n=1 Tax=Sphingomonas aurea TaxID=3063994 RepID=A0ABT9EKP2_9SPHN|nr:hypothetical protein [Sphingomonas sp. KR1UV-12]MDP1027534.1 hypothetical protein [Sphingomonas sp. KR1UV-12]